MHPNPVFRKTDTRRSLDFARQTGFGHLMVVSDDMPLVCIGSVDLSLKRPLLGWFECTPWAFFRPMQNVVDMYCIL